MGIDGFPSIPAAVYADIPVFPQAYQSFVAAPIDRTDTRP
jgi:hypothetical protein